MASDNLGAEARGPADWVKRLADADKIRLVIAGNRREFMAWCRRVNRMPGVDALHVRIPEDLRGRGNKAHEVVKVGTFRGLRWMREAEEVIAHLGLKVRED